MSQAEPNTKTKVQVNTQLKEPSLFKLIYINDNETAMEFVIKTLMEIFHYKAETAESIMLDIHEKGSAVVAVLPYEMAEQKGVEVTVMARHEGWPLQVKLEPDS